MGIGGKPAHYLQSGNGVFARSVGEIIKELQNGRGEKYDATVADILLRIIRKGEFDLSIRP